MDKNEFIEKVRNFQDIYCKEYMRKCQTVFNVDNEPFSVVIKCIDFNGYKWDIPICVDNFGNIGIDIGDAGFLYLNGTGLYCYLYHEAKSRIS